jgi:hypothetical protein
MNRVPKCEVQTFSKPVSCNFAYLVVLQDGNKGLKSPSLFEVLLSVISTQILKIAFQKDFEFATRQKIVYCTSLPKAVLLGKLKCVFSY